MSEENGDMAPPSAKSTPSTRPAPPGREEDVRGQALQASGAGAGGRVWRWLWVVLVVSLSLNMLVLGAIGAMLWMHQRAGTPFFADMGRVSGVGVGAGAGGGPLADAARRGRAAPLHMARPGLIMISLRRLLRRLPPERRRALRQHMRAHRQQIMRAFRQVARARVAFLRLLQQGNPPPAQLDAALSALLRAEEQARRALLELVRDMASAMTPAERQLFARIMQQGARPRLFFRP